MEEGYEEMGCFDPNTPAEITVESGFSHAGPPLPPSQILVAGSTSNSNCSVEVEEISDLLSLLYLPRCSLPPPHSMLPNSSISFPDIMSSSSAAAVMYDPLFHLNFPLQPRDQYQQRNGSCLLGVEDQIHMDANGGGINMMYYEGGNNNDNSNLGGFDNGVLEFNSGGKRKGRGSGKSRTFPTERERRVHFTDRFFDLKNLIPNPTKVAGSTTNSFNDDLKLPTMEEFSVFPSVVSFPNSETHNQIISNIDNNHLIHQMIHVSNWDNSGFFMNTSDPNTTTTLIPDLLSLLHLPRCSVSLPSSNLSDIMPGSCFTYDPLFHLNLPPQPPLIPANDYSGFLLGTDHTNTTQRDQPNVGDENNNAQFDSGIIEFSKEIRRKGRGKQKNKPFTTERERRCHLNERYEAMKMLIPSPSKGDRASILQDGIDYINELRRRVSELKYLVERKKCGGRHKNNNAVDNNNNSDDRNNDDDDDENMEKKPESDVIDQCSSNNSLRCSWLQRKSKVTEVNVRIVDDEVKIKVVQKKKINCLLVVSKVLDQLHLDLHHVAGGQIGEHYSFLLNTKINEGSTIYASAIANRVIEVVDKHYMAALPINNY